MTDPVHTCESCGKPIYAGEKVCTFWHDQGSQLFMCEEHAATRSDAIDAYRELLSDPPEPNEDEPFDAEALEAEIVKLELDLATIGDGPLQLEIAA